jgi:hypothetical protein
LQIQTYVKIFRAPVGMARYAPMNRTMIITNRSKKPRLIQIEPEGADFWVLPEQTFELRANTTTDDARFELWDGDHGLSVFPSDGMGYISVFHDGQELECGHQRPS